MRLVRLRLAGALVRLLEMRAGAADGLFHRADAAARVVATMTVRWGLSVLDWRSHAVVDEYADHPSGCYRATCGHHLMRVTPLVETPGGRTCEECAEVQFNHAIAPGWE
ncbi:MAG: hypothetical protein ACRDSH_24020 [Pseudonocardiaceae bacterium]